MDDSLDKLAELLTAYINAEVVILGDFNVE